MVDACLLAEHCAEFLLPSHRRALVPDSVKAELLAEIKRFILSL